MKQLAESIRPGDATLFLLMKEITTDKVVERINDYGGVVLKTSLADTREQMLRNALAGAVASDAGVPAGASNPDRGARASETSRRRCRLDWCFGCATANTLFNSLDHIGEEGVRGHAKQGIQADDKRVPLASRGNGAKVDAEVLVRIWLHSISESLIGNGRATCESE